MVILNVMFGWLVSAGYLAGNPLSLSRQRQRKAKPRITRYLDPSLWAEVKQYIDRMPRESDRERAHYHRNRWLFTLLYLGGLRISEVGENTMGAFFCRRDRDGEERWWLEVLGKGDKTRLVPATSELMAELARYRRECGLAPFPSPGEETPLVLPIGKSQADDTSGASQHREDRVREGRRAAKDAGARVRRPSGSAFASFRALAPPYCWLAYGGRRC